MVRKSGDYFVLEKLSAIPGLIHGFSSRKLGNMGVRGNIDRFLSPLGLDKKNIIIAQQVHKNRVEIVGEKQRRKIVLDTDGLVTREKGIILGVRSSDCLPILFCDPGRGIIGCAHAGWKGVLGKIAARAVGKMKIIGARPADILVGIGPHIGRSCYDVEAERADKFIKKFGNLKGMVIQNKEKTFLNLVVPTIAQLIKAGMRPENIEVASACTSCRNTKFFSHRRGDDGDILGVISLKA
jgi:YfiH family protein